MSTGQVSFERQVQRTIDMMHIKLDRLIDNVDAHVGRSIIWGSATTGAPGQPVDKEQLRPSWRQEFTRRGVSRWISRKKYAAVIEYNLRGAQLRSKVGGFHSVTLTRIGFPCIVKHELALLGHLGYVSGGRGSKYRDLKTGRFV